MALEALKSAETARSEVIAMPAQIELHAESRRPSSGYPEPREAALGVGDGGDGGQSSVSVADCLVRKPVLAYLQSRVVVFCPSSDV